MPRRAERAVAEASRVAPALGLIEVSSIARGIIVSDVMVKRAPVSILFSRTISPGKHIVLIAGDVASVDEAMRSGVAQAGSALVDSLFLPAAHDQLAPAIAGRVEDGPFDSIAVVETLTVAATILAADAAVKAAEVVIVEMRLGEGLGGKGFFTLTGPLPDIEAASDAAAAAIDAGLLVGRELIPSPHEDLRNKLLF